MRTRCNPIKVVANLFMVILLGVGSASCHYDNLEQISNTIPSKVDWALDSSIFGESKLLLNSMTVNDSLLLVANSFEIWNIIPSKVNKSIVGNYITNGGNSSGSGLYPPSLSRNISVSVLDPNRLAIFPTKCAICAESIIIFNPPYSSSTTSIKGFKSQVYWSGGNKGGYPTIASRYILAPFECEFSTHTASFALIKIDTVTTLRGSPELYGPGLKLNSYKIVNVTDDPVDSYYFSAAYYDKFFIRAYRYSWKIDTTGNATKLPFYHYEMFMLNNKLFALSINSELYVSEDKGENWNLFATLQYPYANLQYHNVGSELYATFESQIWKVTMLGNQINFTELQNHGLETNLITSINKCGKYVFATTLSGLYYKDTAHFKLLKTN
jgi:hypothetical protein